MYVCMYVCQKQQEDRLTRDCAKKREEPARGAGLAGAQAGDVGGCTPYLFLRELPSSLSPSAFNGLSMHNGVTFLCECEE